MSARPWINYTEAGYDPTDGLTAGRWMRDTWGVVVWVQIGPSADEIRPKSRRVA